MRMAHQILRPLSTHQLFTRSALLHRFLSPFFPIPTPLPHQKLRNFNFQSRGLRLPQTSLPLEVQKENVRDDTESPAQKSRNEKKREARRAVKWGMDLASFSPPQIKKILRVASLDEEVFEALMLVKRLGPDVKEGKRRQFSYIGRLLREVQPELMDTLIQASKDGDHSKIHDLASTVAPIVEGEEVEEFESEEEEEVGKNYIDVASRWLDGLIINDSDITKEVYSIHSVEFDRQELRKLVRKVHSSKSRQSSEENGGESDLRELASAEKSLTHFLCSLAKQMPME